MNLNIIFMGSSAFSVPVLNALQKKNWVKAVITQPDKSLGRGRKVTPSIIKITAQDSKLPVYQPIKLTQQEIVNFMDYHAAQLIVVAAYGKILPKWLLDYPNYGAINVHASLLPKYRGASPIQAAIMNGDRQTGVTIMKIDEGLDTGDILAQEAIEISKNETGVSLSSKLAELGAELLVDTIKDYIENRIHPIKQNSAKATMTTLIKKEDGDLDFNQPAEILERKIRAFNPWPICFFRWDGGYLRVFEAELSDQISLEPFEYGIFNRYPCVGTSTQALILKTVQPSGKNRMDGKSFLNGVKNWLGE